MKLNVSVSQGGDPSEDLSFENRLLTAAAGGQASLFMYSWSDPVLVLGRLQDLEGIDEGVCERRGVSIFRRPTGGTGVLQNADLNISLALPLSHPWAKTIHGLYAKFLDTIEGAMNRLEVPMSRPARPLTGRYRRSPICFEDQALESLLFEGKKSLGCAQARKRSAALVHGTLLFGFDPDLHAEVFNVPRERVEAAITNVSGATSMEAAMAALAPSFTDSLRAAPVVNAPALARRPMIDAPFAASAKR